MMDKIDFSQLKALDIAKVFDVKATTINGWRKLGCPATNIGMVFTYNLKEVIKWRIEHLGLLMEANNGDTDSVIKEQLMEIMVSPDSGGAARVNAAKQLRDLEKSGSSGKEAMPQMVMFTEVRGADEILEATGNVTVKCPKCGSTMKFKPV